MTHKKTYVVRGSEDGIIGVYSNFKRAYNKAVEYASMDGEYEVELEKIVKSKENQYGRMVRISCSYAKAQKRSNWIKVYTKGEETNASIEMFYLNA